MNRRDFLFLRSTPRGRVLELSCKVLYMRALNAGAGVKSPADRVFEHEPWMGEPPTDFETTGVEWLHQIEDELCNVDVLRLLDEEWLASTGISEQLEPLLTAFRNRGGRVEAAKG
jgi:hypothetical protein